MFTNVAARAALLLGAALAASGCTGGGASGSGGASLPIVAPSNAPPHVVQAQKSQNNLVIIGDTAPAGRASSSLRHAKYVSPSTNLSQIVVTTHGTPTVVFTSVADLSNGSPNCTGSGPGRICTIPLQLSAGNDDFTLKTYDLPPVAGAIPGTAKQLAQSVVTQNIVAGQANSVTFLLSAIVVGAPPVNGGTTYASAPDDGVTHSIALAVAAADADGNVITGPIPFFAPVPVSLTESGGVGHAHLVLNGVNVGASTNITKATDVLTVAYDGLSPIGYSIVTSIGGTNFRISPLTIAPKSTTITNLTDTRSVSITEAPAPGSIAYSATPTGCAAFVSGSTVTGSGPAATEGFNSSIPGGTNATCSIIIADSLGSSLPYAITFSSAGPITAPGVVTFPTGPASGGGSCATSIAFTSAGQTALFSLSDPGYAGVISSVSSTPATATVSVSGTNATVTAVAAGNTTLTFTDTVGNSFPCAVSVTTSSGSVQ